MARRKRPDYVPPARRVRPDSPSGPPSAGEPDTGYFPPGTWRKVLLGGGVGAAGLVALFLASLLNDAGDGAQERALTRGTCTLDTRADADPPAGGPRDARAAAPGTYTGAAVPPDAALVRAMAQGKLVLWHRPGVGVAAAHDLARAHAKDVVVVERAALPVPLALTAWGSRLLCQEPEPAVLERFTDTRRGRGPE